MKAQIEAVYKVPHVTHSVFGSIVRVQHSTAPPCRLASLQPHGKRGRVLLVDLKTGQNGVVDG